MSKRRVGLNLFLLFWCVKNLFADDRNNLLDELTKTKTPAFSIVHEHEHGNNQPMALSNDLTPNVQPLEPPHDRRAYLLYHILRTTQETEGIDSEALEKFEKTENVLREALRVRCNNLNTCVKRCPKKKTYTCKLSCQEEYDDYDVCNRPKKVCKKPRCGVTKPPYWLLRNLNDNE
ncbi:uncharacterized protein LOC116775682 [Danaus plexippus]|nr:uncharacterized protein LOC116775682 [Danaus plexippus]